MFHLDLDVHRGEGEQDLVESCYLTPHVSMDGLRRIPKVLKEMKPF